MRAFLAGEGTSADASATIVEALDFLRFFFSGLPASAVEATVEVGAVTSGAAAPDAEGRMAEAVEEATTGAACG